MSYEETVLQMVHLTFVSHQNRWVNLSLRNLTSNWLHRIEERSAGVNHGGRVPSFLQFFASLNQPHAFVKFFEKYPTGMTHLVSTEDKAYFLAIAQYPGQKPIPFVPSSMPRSKFGSRRLDILRCMLWIISSFSPLSGFSVASRGC